MPRALYSSFALFHIAPALICMHEKMCTHFTALTKHTHTLQLCANRFYTLNVIFYPLFTINTSKLTYMLFSPYRVQRVYTQPTYLAFTMLRGKETNLEKEVRTQHAYISQNCTEICTHALCTYKYMISCTTSARSSYRWYKK